MAGLPHYTNSQAGSKKHEPFVGSLFEVNLLPPASIGDGSILLEHVNTVGGLVSEPGQDVLEQKYKQATRSYANSQPETTTVDLAINFSLNLNEANELYVYKKIRDWKRLVWNPLTGEQSLKKDYVGTIVVTNYNRAGEIFWIRTFHECWVKGGLPEFGLDYAAADAQVLDVTFRSDWWSESMN
jgi:hypothetical protein